MPSTRLDELLSVVTRALDEELERETFDDDVRVAAAFLEPFAGRVLRRREEAADVFKGLLAVLRASGRERFSA
jgi:hypothetical protein